MIKEELIENIKNIDAVESFMSEIIWVKRNDVLGLVYQLDEPEKPVVPEYIADYIDSEQYSHSTLAEAIDNMKNEVKVIAWFYVNSEMFAKAWLYGYEVEKEKLYKVSLKKNGIGIGAQQQDGSLKEQFTKTELSEYGFDNLSEYEVEEVKE